MRAAEQQTTLIQGGESEMKDESSDLLIQSSNTNQMYYNNRHSGPVMETSQSLLCEDTVKIREAKISSFK